MQRSEAPELLDGPLLDAAALRGNLRDLERVNRWLGGTSLSRRAIDHLADVHPAGDRPTFDLLDVGTGAADIPIALLASRDGVPPPLRITAIDARPEILAAALVRRPAIATTEGLQLHLGDGRVLPYPDRSFDVVHASLVVHHLAPPDVVTLLTEMRRVARTGIVINDLVRSRPALVGAWALTRVATRNRYTRHDAPLSVRRAYTLGELESMLARAGMRIEARWWGPVRHRVALAARASG